MSFTPYNIQDWLRRTPAVPVRRRNTYIEIPAFNYTGLEWLGASECVAQFNFSASNKFTLITLPTKPTDVNFGLCIRYRIGEIIYRFKLWDDDAFKLTEDVPLYTNEIIRPNFVIEVWSYEGETTAVNEEALRTITSVRVLPTDVSQLGTSAALAVGAEFRDLENTNSGQDEPITGSYLWYDINDPLGAYSNPVQVWYGRGAAGGINDLTATGPGTSPALVSASAEINGLDYVSFDGVNDILFGQKSYAFPMTIYAYVKILNPAFFDFYLSLQGVVVENLNLIAFSATEVEALYAAQFAVGNIVAGEWTLIVMQIESGSKVKIRINQDAVAESAGVPTVESGVATLNVGGNALGGAPGANFGEFGITEIIAYNSIHTVAQMDTMYKYFLRKYQGGMTLPLTFNEDVAWLDNDN
jgi:hypothetical protein